MKKKYLLPQLSKKIIFCVSILLMNFAAKSQISYNITSWDLNTSGLKAQYYSSNGTTVNTLTDSADVQQVCYNTDTIYLRTNILADYIMGPWPGDPFIAAGQNKSYIFPRNPTYPSSTHQTRPVGGLGILVNGVAIFDDGDGKSYNTSTNTNANNGSGVWNQIAWIAHASELDAGNAHPDPSKIYHNHSNPVQLCSVTSSTSHSPIIGWSFDGWPIYGPFGYSTATNASSSIKRMTSSWALRNITTRTTLYTGTTTSQTGPAVSTTFPLGIYIEDYGYTASSGDLDYYNGRYCVTPEYPSGTYAYFLNTDASGNPSYPNMVGPKYYGSVFLKNFGTSSGTASAPKVGVSCYSHATTNIFNAKPEQKFAVFPNPTKGQFTIQLNTSFSAEKSVIKIYNSLSEIIYKSDLITANAVFNLANNIPQGVYFIHLINENGQTQEVQKIIIE